MALPLTLAVGADAVKAASLDKKVSQQYLLQPMLGLFETEPEPLPPLALIVKAQDIEATHVEPSLMKRLFRALATAVEPAQAFADTPPTIGTTKGKGLMAQDADPNFELWQKKADEKLQVEQALRQTPPHRLALQHPDQYIVVCEAGCRKNTEEIVYAVAKVEAQAVVTRLEPSSAAMPDAGGRLQEPDAILCVAGCYESPKVHAARQKSASLEVPAGKFAVATSQPVAAQRLATPRRDANRRGAARHDIAASVKVARASIATPASPWRTEVKVVHAPAVRLARIRPWQTRTIYEKPARIAAKAHASKGQWRTKVVFAKAPRTSRLDRVKRLRQALLPMHEARLVQYAVVETRF